MAEPGIAERRWTAMLVTGFRPLRTVRSILGAIPSHPRCAMCAAPFEGPGARLMRATGHGRWAKNPNYCHSCFDHIVSWGIGGIELELSMLFADVRGSMGLAEKSSPTDFTRLMNRFFKTSMDVLLPRNAWIDKMVGDQVIAFFVPGLVGPNHAQVAVSAAEDLLKQTRGWVPVGAGVHTGIAYMGAIGDGAHVTDTTAMGDSVNVTARLSSEAQAGELLITDQAYAAAKLDRKLDRRELQLTGRTEPIGVRVLNLG